MTHKKKSKIIKSLSITLVCLTIFASVSYVRKSYQAEAENKKQAELEAKRLAQIEAEKNEPVIGAKKEYAKKYGYDAREIMKKIENRDYSNDNKKMVFLTFDDGPSTTNTPKILDILKQNDVKATFFICGYSITQDDQKEILKRSFNEGNAIANHTFSHDMKKLYPNRSLNLDAFKEDLKQNEEVMKSILGDNFSTRVIRTPGGFYSWKNMEPLREYMDEANMANLDWNALNRDAEGPRKYSEQLGNIAIETSKDKDIVVLLMHDTYGKEETVKSLQKVIDYYKENGYEFKTLI